MKALFILGLALVSCYGGSITLAWNPNTDSVTGYKVFIGTASGGYYASNVVVGVSNTTTTFTNLTGGIIYYFAAKAYREIGTNYAESGFSTEVSWFLSPHAPEGVRIEIGGTNTAQFIFGEPRSLGVEWSPDLLSWNSLVPENMETLGVTVRTTKTEQQFWRVK